VDGGAVGAVRAWQTDLPLPARFINAKGCYRHPCPKRGGQNLEADAFHYSPFDRSRSYGIGIESNRSCALLEARTHLKAARS